MNTGNEIVAIKVEDFNRIKTLPNHFANYLTFESYAFGTMDKLCKEYNGGYWNFFELSNGGFYMTPKMDGEVTIQIDGNCFSGSMTPDAAGLVICLLTYSNLSFKFEHDSFAEHYHWLRDYALDHNEGSLIFRAID